MDRNPSLSRLVCGAIRFVRWRLIAACIVFLVAGAFSASGPDTSLTNAMSMSPAASIKSAPLPEPNADRPLSLMERGRAEDQYRQKAAKAAEQQRQVLEKVNKTLAVADEEHARAIAQINAPPPPPRLIERYPGILLLVFAVALLGVLTKLALDRHAEHAEIRALCGGYLSDGTEVAKFVMPDLFAAEPIDLPAEEIVEVDAASACDEKKPDPTAEFFANTPKVLQRLSDVLKKVNGTSVQAERQTLLRQLDRGLGEVILNAKPWALRPAWQVATALQLLVNRVAEKPKDITPSVLRTIAAGLDSLRDVSVPDIRPNLIIEPPLKILAVDDDVLCRRAVAYALQKAGLTADFAENGQQAVEKARTTAYDMMFLDILMPEMDGLTACARIRETETNAKTEVVFVTVQTDFQTRVQTTALGGSDLIAKPFLVFELTVKSIVCAVRKRLALLPRASIAAAPAASAAAAGPVGRKPKLDPQAAAHLKECFFNDAPQFISGIRDTLDEVKRLPDGPDRHAALKVLDVHLAALAAAAKLNELKFTARAASAVEALAKKLHRQPKHVTPSTLNTLTQAVSMLERVCVPGGDTAIVKGSAVRLLVIEDEPLARRAVLGALQLAFPRPDSANDGAAALEICSRGRYDVIFTDIAMPKVNGLDFCRELRLGGPNIKTPVVFITSHDNDERRKEVRDVGGADFITKPFIPAEITVKALILASEHRLNRPLNAGPAKDVAQTVLA